jgi:hypothetical protein
MSTPEYLRPCDREMRPDLLQPADAQSFQWFSGLLDHLK